MPVLPVQPVMVEVLENGSGEDHVPAGGTVIQWARFGAVPPEQKSVTVGVGGFANVLPAHLTSS
jgi:hypothetical protein